ncbi:FMRFamide receptor-like [Mya arenaria]|uniref:FMRFamide receptor-like n=1 Tax=Mya arenaria TaxID=6604 RepID=UPI0022DF6BC6|nr:FMRFamide receptor-like [Mya arenaria]
MDDNCSNVLMSVHRPMSVIAAEILDYSDHNLSHRENYTLGIQQSVSFSLYITRLIVQSYLVPIVVTSGIIGNIFNIIVLINPKMRTSTNVYLMSLAMCDSLYLLFCLTLAFLHCSNTDLSKEAFMYIPNAKVLSDLFSNTAVWLTVCFTLERFIAVRLPIRGKAWCTVSKAKVAILVTFVFSAGNTLPEFFETKIVQIAGNGSAHYQCESTEFAETYSYHIGYYWWFVAIFTFAPLVLLAMFNSLLIKSVWQANRKRQLLSQTRITGEANKANKEQQRVTLMLISVVLIFLVCQAPQAILLIYWSYVQANNLPYQGDMVKIAGNVCNLLVQINASVNFFLYSYFSSKFRKTFKDVICICRHSDRQRCVHRPLHNTFRGKSASRHSMTSSSLISSSSFRSHRREVHSSRTKPLETRWSHYKSAVL